MTIMCQVQLQRHLSRTICTWYGVGFKCTELWDAVIQYQEEERHVGKAMTGITIIGMIKNLELTGKWTMSFVANLFVNAECGVKFKYKLYLIFVNCELCTM